MNLVVQTGLVRVSVPGGYPLITHLKDVSLGHFASAPCMPCKLKKLLIHTQELNLHRLFKRQLPYH